MCLLALGNHPPTLVVGSGKLGVQPVWGRYIKVCGKQIGITQLDLLQ
jgi:hypothetical protein